MKYKHHIQYMRGNIDCNHLLNEGFLMDNTSSIYLYVKLKDLVFFKFLFLTRFWRNSVSFEYENKSARRGAELVPIGMPTCCWKKAPPNWQICYQWRNRVHRILSFCDVLVRKICGFVSKNNTIFLNSKRFTSKSFRTRFQCIMY